jgi:hypothetical protein
MNCVQLKGYIYFSFIFNTSQTGQLNKEFAAFRAENNLKSQKKQKGIAPRERDGIEAFHLCCFLYCVF